MSHRRGAVGTLAPPAPPRAWRCWHKREIKASRERERGCEGDAWVGGQRSHGRAGAAPAVGFAHALRLPREPVTGGAGPAGARAWRETRGKSRDASRASGREGGEGPGRPRPGSAKDGAGSGGERRGTRVLGTAPCGSSHIFWS
ncbi:uncharacterized protein [Taeniopygia guttata]|uniref:uncharacterized protein isoform X1 n=1 Tax=Taeniopygia guttata TaxID=59729 RepID=UPI003BB8B0F8